MADGAGSYSVIRDYGYSGTDQIPDRVDMDVHWVIAVVRLGTPLSFSRATMSSSDNDLTAGAMLRAETPLIITDDCMSLSINGTKKNHKKSLSMFLKQSTTNYLVEILPGDWVFAWLTNNRGSFYDVLANLGNGSPCNSFDSGLKFMGRIEDVRKILDVEEASGVISSGYNVSAYGFEELDTMLYYDKALLTEDQTQQAIGTWLFRLGLDLHELFGEQKGGVKQNNINTIIPTMLDLIVGKGPKRSGVINIPLPRGSSGKNLRNSPSVQEGAPFSYLVPQVAAQILGVDPKKAVKGVLSYADMLELMMGVQSYTDKSGPAAFIPELKVSTPCRRLTGTDMLGTFLPYHPTITNRPLWSVLQQYLNPTINEMFTCMRVNPEGRIMPTMIVRQIPFTTESFQRKTEEEKNEEYLALVGMNAPVANKIPRLNVTRFLSLPRWEIPEVLITHLDVGRSNSTRTNFVHIYGSSSYQQNNTDIQYQMVVNPPVRDDIDIQRSGLRPYMATVECWVSDQVGKTAGSWMHLVADWTIGSHLTLNGTLRCKGIQAPVCEGDNVLIDDTVYHIEGISHQAQLDGGSGRKQWNTTLHLTNGMRWGGLLADDENSQDSVTSPIYPGFMKEDNTQFDPGLTMEGRQSLGGDSVRTPVRGKVSGGEVEIVSGTDGQILVGQAMTIEGPSQLSPMGKSGKIKKSQSKFKRRKKVSG